MFNIHRRKRYGSALLLCLGLGVSREVGAQSPAPATPWFEPQTATIASRYRFVETSDSQVTANQGQFKDAFRARVNLDKGRRLTINIGAFSGASFTSSWDAMGVGTGNASTAMHVKQLYAAVTPVRDVEIQIGGLYFNRGESTEITTYDDDGYLMGERITLTKPRKAYFDVVSVTRAALDPAASPGVVGRLQLLNHQNYWQAQVVKHFSPIVRTSADFTSVAGAETVRAAVAVSFPKGAPLSSLRFEQYRRMTPKPANGFAVVIERSIATKVRLQVGYASIDGGYGGLNADRLQRGRRTFMTAAIPLGRALSAQVFATQAFANSYAVPNRTRIDVILTYDILKRLKH